MPRFLSIAIVGLVLTLHAAAVRAQEEEADPPEVAIGERLFLETRFAQFFFAHSGGNMNAVLPAGDPVVATTETTGAPLPGPFAGQSINCRSCHLVDEQKGLPGGGNRTYSDFARKSPIPAREDGLTTTPRNSPALVDASLPRGRRFFLHFDAEFPTGVALVQGTLTGRNFGWLPAERALAVAHVARVIREDDGTGQLARDFGGAYRDVLTGTSSSIPPDFRLPPRFRVDVTRASDEAILNAVARLIDAYMQSLVFLDDEAPAASPYDRFLEKNILSRVPREFESDRAYTDRIRVLVRALEEPDFVTAADGAFTTQTQDFVFGPLELEGLRTFLGRGRCAACHPLPHFTDFAFHNTGAAQEEYDAVHGAGSFALLQVPDLATRAADPDAYLPATPAHPNARGPFRALVTAARPGATDLGLWNVYRNGDLARPAQQRRIESVICRSRGEPSDCGRRHPAGMLLDAALGLFKTPALRDLGQSAPYLHTGRMDTLEDVVRFYVDASTNARAGRVRSTARELAEMRIGMDDVPALAAFLRALNQDYE